MNFLISGKVCVFSLYIFKFLGSKAGVVNLLKVFRKLNGCYMSCWKFFFISSLRKEGEGREEWADGGPMLCNKPT